MGLTLYALSNLSAPMCFCVIYKDSSIVFLPYLCNLINAQFPHYDPKSYLCYFRISFVNKIYFQECRFRRIYVSKNLFFLTTELFSDDYLEIVTELLSTICIQLKLDFIFWKKKHILYKILYKYFTNTLQKHILQNDKWIKHSSKRADRCL